MTTWRVVLCGYYGQGNGGDEALLASLLQMLPPNAQPVVLSGNPQETTQRYGVESHDRKSLSGIWKAFQGADGFIWGGGSLMQDITSLGSPLYYSALMGYAQLRGLKTVAWAQGIGPLLRPQTRWLAQQMYRRVSKVSVRDRKSAELLQQWQIPGFDAPDPVWSLEGLSVKGLANLPAPRVAVTLRTHPQLTPSRLTSLAYALRDFQIATQTCILLVPFQPKQDLEITKTLQAELTGESHIFCLEDPRELMGLFQGVEMAIGMRYHSLLMAAAAGCRCFALSYDPKINRLMEDLEMPGWELSQIPEDASSICKTWIEQYANGDELSPDRILFLKDRSQLHGELLQQIFC